MKIEHIALWSRNIETMHEFYTHYFDAKANKKYKNESKAFESYFLDFEDGARLELMHMPVIPDNSNDPSGNRAPGAISGLKNNLTYV